MTPPRWNNFQAPPVPQVPVPAVQVPSFGKMLGTFAVAIGAVAIGAYMLDLHGHSCETCGHRWHHLGAFNVGDPGAHACKKCGTVQWWKDGVPHVFRAVLRTPPPEVQVLDGRVTPEVFPESPAPRSREPLPERRQPRLRDPYLEEPFPETYRSRDPHDGRDAYDRREAYDSHATRSREPYPEPYLDSREPYPERRTPRSREPYLDSRVTRSRDIHDAPRALLASRAANTSWFCADDEAPPRRAALAPVPRHRTRQLASRSTRENGT